MNNGIATRGGDARGKTGSFSSPPRRGVLLVERGAGWGDGEDPSIPPMPDKPFSSVNPARRNTSGLPLFLGLGVVVAFFVSSAAISYYNVRSLQEATGLVGHSHEVIETLEDVLSLMRDAETGQRGFIITGNEKYLAPYTEALPKIDARVADVTRMTADNPNQQGRIPAMKLYVDQKRDELAKIISLRREEKGLEKAQERVSTDTGKIAMDGLRLVVAEMQRDERKLLDQRFRQTGDAFQAATQSGILSGALGIFLAAVVALLLRRAAVSRQRLEWMQKGQAMLNEKLIGEQRLAGLGENALRFLCEYTGAQAGAIFIEESAFFRRFATYAVPASAGVPERFSPGEGLLGQAVKDARVFLVSDVPEGYLAIGSGLGTERPRHLLIAPARVDGGVNAVLELGFFQPVRPECVALLERTAESIGVAVRSAHARARIEDLLEETQRQSSEVQAQSEELRVSNEELEEQSRALQKTQTQLEEQQMELKQTNVQLEEQAHLLETRMTELSQAKQGLERQARVVEQASRYKSDFLANMSHELRTPLNSSLILAQLLAENRGGNLSEEQIKFARTIQSSGNDLLALINDVLDLSKIEAGHMDVESKRLSLSDLLGTLRGMFEPVAASRGLALHMNLMPGVPESMDTDPRRLEQVLRNLLSNALKFTEKGSVTLDVAPAGPGRVSFAVTDTGIGIDAAQQRIIFEPFCQADGTTNRKYGGTGLGLSISRELSRLLGGGISLMSEVGKGSTFTVTLPVKIEARSATSTMPRPVTAPVPLPPPEWPREEPVASAAPATSVADDRGRLSNTRTVILVVEDDTSFAGILADLARDQNFQCLVTGSAREALELARKHLPGAIVLDVGLPDGSGLFVLDRLKQDPATRHIPVHVISGTDYAGQAMSMGAVGYMLKPVAKEQLTSAFQAMEARLTHSLRRVLVVEDDPVQLTALCALLSSRDVETVGARDAADCLEKLQGGTFDCMVLDLSLPDATGFALLEKISGDDAYPFPPVIIYTGRDLSPEEEQRLRRYSKSIIIKGAKSPERLLDEVALFLHQVVAKLPAEQQRMIEKARSRDEALEGRRILLAEDDVRNIFALTSLLEPLGLTLDVARNGREALEALERIRKGESPRVDLVLMDIMMPEMDGLTAMRAIRQQAEWKRLPIIALTAKAMATDQEQCLAAGANDYLAKPLDVEKLLSLVRVWMPR